MIQTVKTPVPTILLVDDHEVVVRTLHNYLEMKGYNLLEARHPEEALLIAECYPATIHVLVTDLILATMHARELVRRLLPFRPAMQVIITSGLPDVVVAQKGLTPKVPVLQKPVSPDLLHVVADEVLANPQPERTVASLVHKLPIMAALAPHVG